MPDYWIPDAFIRSILNPSYCLKFNLKQNNFRDEHIASLVSGIQKSGIQKRNNYILAMISNSVMLLKSYVLVLTRNTSPVTALLGMMTWD